MNEEQQKIIELVKNAKLDNSNFPDSWLDPILNQITNQFAKGYLAAERARLGDIFTDTDPEFRDEFLAVCNFNIWK